MFGKFRSLSRAKKIGVGVAAFTMIGLTNAAAHPQSSVNLQASPAAHAVQQATTQVAAPQQKTPVVTTQMTSETQPIPFGNVTVEAANLDKGVTKVTTPGVNGVKTLTYKLTLTDGVQTAKELVSQVTTVQPVTQVTSVGTYVAPQPVAAQSTPSCPNGTYVNSAGNTVCSPYSSPSAPAGATAQCVDGSYSFSQSHSGTCSHHGGVATWL